jgi:hypothetical protein
MQDVQTGLTKKRKRKKEKEGKDKNKIVQLQCGQ